MSESSAQLVASLRVRALASEEQSIHDRKVASLSVICLAVVVSCSALSFLTIYLKLPVERYIYTDNAKAICEAQLEPEPLVTSNTVLDFAKDCMLDMDAFAYDSVEKDLTRVANRCFTPGFRKNYFEAYWLSDRIATVKEQFLRVSSETTGPVLVESEGPTPEGYRWVVQVPVKRTFRQGDSIKGRQERFYRVEVFRVVKSAFNPVALGINKLDERTERSK